MPPPTPQRMLLFILAIAFLIGLIQVGLVSIAFDKLGLTRESAFLLLLLTLAGSMINLPLFTLRSENIQPPPIPPELERLPFFKLPPYTGRISVKINVGGAVVPVVFSLYLIAHTPLNPAEIVAAVMAVALIASRFSKPIPGIGIGIPVLLAPLAAAFVAFILDPEHRAPLAYIGGTLGVLIGADLMRLKEIRRLGSPFASIGGAGTLDGVFLTGIIAVLLA